MEDVTNFYMRQDEPNRSCFLAMREIVCKVDEEVEETVKYGSPCFVYRGRAFCYLWKDKKTNEPYFLLVEGKLLNHPILEAGDRKRMKILRVDPNEDLLIDVINSVLYEALDLYKNGTIRTKNMAKKFDIKTVWKEKMAFDSHVGNHVIRMDTTPEMGDDSGPSPKHLVLAGLAGCTGMDVVSLLRKMRVDFSGFEIQIETELTEEHPQVFAAIHMVYRVVGKDLDKQKVEKAINLSQERYCGVSAMLKKNGPLEYSIEYSES